MRLFLRWEDCGNCSHGAVGDSGRPCTGDHTAYDEHGRRLGRSANSRTNLEDEKEDKEAPLRFIRIILSVSLENVMYLYRKLAVDFAAQRLERCTSKLVGAAIPGRYSV